MTWGFEALHPYQFGGCSRVSWFPLQGDCRRGALPRSSTKQQNTKRSSSTVFTRGLAGLSPVCCTTLLSSSWQGHHPLNVETGDRSPVGVPNNVEVAEEASWVVTPTQRFESAPHPEGMAEKTCSGLQPRVHRCESCCPLQISESSSVWPESPAWTRDVAGSNPASQTKHTLAIRRRVFSKKTFDR